MPGVAVQDVAHSLYIHPFMLSRWRKQAREGTIVTKGVVVDKEIQAELKELRRVKKGSTPFARTVGSELSTHDQARQLQAEVHHG